MDLYEEVQSCAEKDCERKFDNTVIQILLGIIH